MTPDASVELTFNRALLLALFILGVVLFVFGAMASDSIASDVSRLFTGGPTDKTVWLMVGGGLAAVGGLSGLARRPGSRVPRS